MEDFEFEPGGLGCHEAFHMTSVLMTLLDEQLCQHPSIQASAEWLSMAEIARRSLYDLYHSIAAKHTPITVQIRAVNYYENDRFDERHCDACEKLYRGPAVYCSLACAEAEAVNYP